MTEQTLAPRTARLERDPRLRRGGLLLAGLNVVYLIGAMGLLIWWKTGVVHPRFFLGGAIILFTIATLMAFAFFVAAAEPLPLRSDRGMAAAGLFAALGGLFAWTLFSYAAKPAPLQNNAPFLLAACAALALRPGAGARREP